MKPVKLIISAFGSYSDLQEIDFTALGTNGIYLITGETGSGKTTIFDAISFALFGRASGINRGNYQMLRSDFAKEKDKTYVEMNFISGSAEYYIKRVIKKTGQDVSLLLPDGTVITGERNIKPKIDEIIGLEQEQFAQIVMIAQNEFLRFLQSGTDDRLKILRRIFGTGKLKNFQELLKSCLKTENEKRDRIIYDFKRYSVDIYKREEQFLEWENQIKIDKKELQKTEKDIDKYDKLKKEFAVKLAAAEELSEKFDELVSFRKLLKEHEEKKYEMEINKKQTAIGEKALRKVKPFADEAARTAKNRAALAINLDAAKKDEKEALSEMQLAEKKLEQLPPLSDAQDVFAELSGKSETLAEQLKKLAILQKDIDIIDKKRVLLSAMQSEYETLNNDYLKADNKYKLLEELFFRGQAGILARKLTDEEPCPVCGSTVHPNPAAFSAGDITEEELNKAKEVKNKTQNKRENKSLECNGILTEIGTLSERFLADFSAHKSLTQTSAPKEKALNDDWETIRTELFSLFAKTQKEAETFSKEKISAEKNLADLKLNWETTTKNKINAELAYKSAQTLLTERIEKEKEASKLCVIAQEEFKKSLQINDFSSEENYINALLTEDELAGFIRKLSDYEKTGEQLIRDVNRLEKETLGKEKPDLEKSKTEADTANAEASVLIKKRDDIIGRLDKTDSMLKELRKAAVDFEYADGICSAVKKLSDTANGKLDFETYAQMAYFERVLIAANQRLKMMSQNRYNFLHKKEGNDKRSKQGLEIDVFDAYTGKPRSTNSLSGGESFMASLSLALGLSDVVQQSAGGIHLDAMFIDEGFGTLDAETLDIAVKTLLEMAGSNRIIGIISHVTELQERVDKQIQIEKTAKGSRIKVVV